MFVLVAALVHAAPFDDRIEALFRPPVGETVAISPSGQRVAYTTRARGELTITIFHVDDPGPKRKIALLLPPGAEKDEVPPAPLRFLRWATETRLVYAPAERVIPLPPVTDKTGRSTPNPNGPTIVSPIMAVDADGSEQGTLVDASAFQETSAEAIQTASDLLRTPQELAATRRGPVSWRMPHLDILGFHPRNREQLVIATSGAYSAPARHLVDIRTGHLSYFGEEWPIPPGEPQVYDWFRLKIVGERQDSARPSTAWSDADLARVQRELSAKFPRRIVELLDWSDTRHRVVFRVTGGSDAGRLFVYQRTEDLVLEILSTAPWLGSTKLNETRWFEFAAPDGARLSGYLTWPTLKSPTSPPAEPPPLLVLFPSALTGRVQPAFDPEAQVLADLGFAVARLNHRCAAGILPSDTSTLSTALDRSAIDDARAVIDWFAAQRPERPFDRQRIAALGHGFGGYLALRALQLQPSVFRCGVALDAPADLSPWLRTSDAATLASSTPPSRDLFAALTTSVSADGKKFSVLEQCDTLTGPVFLLAEPARHPAVDATTADLRARLTRLGRPPEHLALDAGFAAARPASRATAYRKMDEFLRAHLNPVAASATVKIGPTEEIK